uniref:ditrans,polycis-polyprenyl diphosphate synthase [(2E,6E)-farnesyldiphosphate specific] n=1 Tax=Megaselia scalaris TaxID=36166 RepID=T1GY76_MEGSC
MDISKDMFKYSKEFVKAGVSLRLIGDQHLLPSDLKEAIEKSIESTSHCKDFILNIAFAYGSRNEMTNAFKIILNQENKSKINKKLIQENLYLNSKPDMVLRSSGESRLSDFLMCQIYDGILFFEKKLWPEIRFMDLTLLEKPTKKVRLSGYGVELYLKSTEYKSQDDS